MILLPTQRNELFNLIKQRGLYPSQFILEECNHPNYSGLSARVRHLESDLYFLINVVHVNAEEYYSYEYSPTSNKVKETSVSARWSGIIDLYNDWLIALQREVDTIDKWQQLETEMPDFKIVANNGDGKFSYQEVVQIESRMLLLKEKIKEIQLTNEQSKVLVEKLDNLIELAKTANKFDWTSYFLGIITNIILTLFVTPENARQIWEAVKSVFSNFLLN